MDFVDEYDVHKWTFGFEHGKPKKDEYLKEQWYEHSWDTPRIYDHIQCRVKMTNDDDMVTTTDGNGKVKTEKVDLNFIKIKEFFCDAGNIQICSDVWEYERKEGRFISSEDDERIRIQRFYPLREWQLDAIMDLENQNDRQIDFYYDPKGGHGKSHLATHLFEIGKAIRVLMNVGIEDYLKTIASEYLREPRKIVVIDIPRSRFEGKSKTEIDKICTKLNEVLECLKDGVVGDPRYSSRVVNMGAVKVIVFSNYDIAGEGGLSKDRYRAWRLAETYEDDFKTVKRPTVRIKYRG